MIEVAIEAEGELRDQIVALLGQLGFEGFWEDGAVLRSYISESRWTPEMPDEVEQTVGLITRSSRNLRPVITTRRIAEQNWNEEWEKTIRPIHVSEHVVITPSWHPYQPAPGELVLTIDPKMSFGTGYHESTRLILRLLENTVKTGDRVLDIGTGTGVLAIAAIKLGASSAIGIDIDEWSEMNARENAKANGVVPQLTILRGTLADVPPGQFDLVLANIQRTVLVPIMPDMISRLRPSARLLLSGLLLADEEEITLSALAAGARILTRENENEWIALSLQST